VRACAEFVTDRTGRSRIEIVRHGDRRLVRLAPRVPARESSVFQVAALRLVRSLLRFTGGTVLAQLLDDACERLESVARPEDRERLAGLKRKFYAIPFAEKHYRHLDDTVSIASYAGSSSSVSCASTTAERAARGASTSSIRTRSPSTAAGST
jgi:hypothetical protein